MADVLAVGIYMADRPNTAPHMVHALASSEEHVVTQRWIAIAPGGRGRFDVPGTWMTMTEPAPKFELLDRLTEDADGYDWVLLCDDDIEVAPGFLDRLLNAARRHDFAVCQPARTADSFTDHPIVQVMPGLDARRTRFVEIGPLVCLRRDAVPLLLPFGPSCGMGWGLDLVWPVWLEEAGLRMGIVDSAPAAHRIRPSAMTYDHGAAHQAMAMLMARHRHLTQDDAFTVLEAYAGP